MNCSLNYTAGGGSGTHQIKQVNAHGSIGSAGIFIGGNGSGNNTSICFFRNAQGNSAGQVFGQNDWKFRIGSEMIQNYNLNYRQRGFSVPILLTKMQLMGLHLLVVTDMHTVIKKHIVHQVVLGYIHILI